MALPRAGQDLERVGTLGGIIRGQLQILDAVLQECVARIAEERAKVVIDPEPLAIRSHVGHADLCLCEAPTEPSEVRELCFLLQLSGLRWPLRRLGVSRPRRPPAWPGAGPTSTLPVRRGQS